MSQPQTKDYSTTATSDHSESEVDVRRQSRSRTRRGRRRGGQATALGGQQQLNQLSGVTNDLLGQTQQVGEVARGAVAGVGNAVGPTVAGLTNTGGGKAKNKDALSLRLDLNLDVEVTLKARIHGDLTLALLNS